MMLKNKLIFNKYKVKRFKELSEFCLTYEGIDAKNNQPVFLKFEKRNSQFKMLESEAYCLYNLKGFGLPKILSYGKTGLYNVLIEELLGNSLWNLWKLRKKDEKSNLKNVCMVAIQIINRLEYIHSKNYIHKDIKPHNFVNGRKDPHIIYIIDFGFSHKYRSSRTGKHIKYINRKVAIGSLNFISINANIGYEQSRRDDLESLGYMLIFLATDFLPWMRIEELNISKRMKCLKIYNLKKSISVEKLCKGLPEEFAQYMNYIKNLEFEQDPNYDYLRRLFLAILFKNQEKNDLKFFWIINKIKFKKKEINSESRSIPKRGEGFKNRLYNQIKSILERKESQKKEVKEKSLQLEHVNSLNFKYSINSINYSDNKKNKEEENKKNLFNIRLANNTIFNTISYHNDKYIYNFNGNNTNNKENFKDKNKIPRHKIINYNKNIKDEIQGYNIINKNILYGKSNYKNFASPKVMNNKLFFSNTNFSKNYSKLNNEGNNLINNKANNASNKEYSKNANYILKKKKLDKNIIAKRINNYTPLYEREKEKEKINYKYYSDKKRDYYFSPILDYFDSINKNNNNNNLNMKMSLVDKDTSINIGKEKINENNNIYNNISKNSFFFFKNMKVNNLKKSQNNKNKLFKIRNSYQANLNEIENNLTLESFDSPLNLKMNNYFFGRRERESFGFKFKENKNNKKNKINDNSGNDIFSENNSVIDRNLISLKNRIINI